jgi:hypothetical protein
VYFWRRRERRGRNSRNDPVRGLVDIDWKVIGKEDEKGKRERDLASREASWAASHHLSGKRVLWNGFSSSSHLLPELAR